MKGERDELEDLAVVFACCALTCEGSAVSTLIMGFERCRGGGGSNEFSFISPLSTHTNKLVGVLWRVLHRPKAVQ